MCGINGYFQFNDILSTEEINNRIRTMNNQIIHRGPDEGGIYTNSHAGLGMRRLSIIDLSSGKQPIFNEDRTKVIVFNGEIYNYQPIREKLIEQGHKFTTKSDTEVILHAYEEYGENCLNYFDGMFAFAIYDIAMNTLFLGRDRVGEKPLYYYKNNDFLYFGSEIKSLISTGEIEKEINHDALSQYFQLTYIPAPLTIFENIYKLPAGCYMKVNEKGKVNQESYWDVNYKDTDLITDYSECKRLLRDAVFESVESRMISDVPLGAFLSGGIDSSTIVAVMSKISSQPINTFTIGFNIKEYDESNRAKIVSDQYKTNHHVFYLDYEEALQELDYILDNFDEPFADSSSIPTYMVSKEAKKYVKTVLTGDAGDELFAGYSKYLINYYSNKYNKIPRGIRKTIIEKLIYSFPDKTAITRKIRKVVENSEKDTFSQRRNLMCLGFKDSELNLLLKGYSDKNNLNFIKSYYDKYDGNTDEISQTLYTDLKVVLEGDMLPKTDRMSMLASIETRVPLLSKKIIELAARIPSEYKIDRKNQKKIFKDTFEDLIPDKLKVAPKSGFGVPIDYWFRGPLKEELLKLLNKDFIVSQGLFNHDYIEKILNEHFNGVKNRKSELWALFVFQRWYRRYFDAAGTK
jgi:asparagine synthase (glutamine-hydrolysing)